MWQVLQTAADWDSYRARIAHDNNVQTSLLNWGSGPQKYPCMVDGYMPTTTKVVTCYVYLEDVAGLLQAAENLGINPPTQKQVATQRAYAKLHAAPGDPEQEATAVPGYTWQNHANSTTAHILTLYHFLVETRICTQQQYEDLYTKLLAKTDQWTAEDRDVALSKISGSIPPPEDQS